MKFHILLVLLCGLWPTLISKLCNTRVIQLFAFYESLYVAVA